MKTKKYFTSIAVILVLIFCLGSFSAFASSPDQTRGRITLHVADFVNSEPLENMSFRLYYFASAYKNGNGYDYEYVSPYDECNMDMDDLEDSYFSVHLTHYAQTHSLEFTEETTDKNGNAVYENVVAGLYLAVPSDTGSNYYVPSPFVIIVPEFDEDGSDWIFDVTARPKMLAYNWIDTEGDTYISVKKIWEKDKSHPQSVTVSLLRDYKEVERITLDQSNNWSYRWDKLSKKHSWSVVEAEVPEGYKVSYVFSENSVKIINHRDSDTPDESTSSPEGTTKPDELVDTGQLNWPVPVFTIAGLLLFSLGWGMLNFGRKDEEKA